MLKQLIENGEKIYGDLCQAKKGDELERKTWVATSLMYIEEYLEDSSVGRVVLEYELFDQSLTKENAIIILAALKSDLSIQELKKKYGQ